jgi:branched-chain amino acid transport system ATP-binding protein
MTPLTSVDPLLEVKDLTVSAGASNAVRSVTVRVFAGTIATLVGPDTFGKSQALLAIAGLIPSRGTVHFESRRVDGFSPRRLVRLGLVHATAGRRVFPSLSVRENLLLGAWTRRDRYAVHQEIAALFERFPDLGRRHRARAQSLSATERQLLAIARALMAKPRLLLLDEPSAGLPPEGVAEVFEVITRINSEGMPILLAEQYERKALAISDYLYVMDRGAIVKEGVPREISREPEIADAHFGPAHA